MSADKKIEDVLKEFLGSSNECARNVVVLTSFAGIIFMGYWLGRFLFELFQGFRLYVWSQFCSRVDFRKKYGEWAVISGATDGIGLEMAKELARRGHSLVIIGRNAQKLADSKAALEREPDVGEVVTVQIDLADSSLKNYERIRGQIDADNRDIGILINNAGVSTCELRRFNEHDLELMREMINVNIVAATYLTRMIMPGMVVRGRGLVVNNSSMLGSIVPPYMCIYGPTKTFINAFSSVLQMEYSGFPIDIINLTPGAVDTKMMRAHGIFGHANIFNPTPESFARTTLNAVSTRIKSISGNLMHEIYHAFSKIGVNFGLLPVAIKLSLFVTGRKLSPLVKESATLA